MADASAPKPQIKSASDHENPGNFFLYKAVLVTVSLVLVPLFPSLAPDFFNQTFHARSWELLQLIFVGIAVSYGLFSKKNDEPHKIDTAQSYVSKLLQVSSVFDDESERHIEENRFEALNSQYYRGEPVVVVAKENPAVEVKKGVVSQISQRPLLLPVRSLKQRVPSPNEADSSSDRLSSSSRKSRNVDLKKLNVDNKVEEKEEEINVVLRSPIPWRSRSGRMEMREENNNDELTSFGDERGEQELNRVNESRSFRSIRANPSFSSESLSKNGEDVVIRKKSFAPPPPAPPPPPPPSFLRKSVLVKSNSSVGNSAESTKKVLTRSVRSVPTEEELSENEMEVHQDLKFGVENQDLVKSVRTFRPNESMDHNPKEETQKMKKFSGNLLANTTTTRKTHIHDGYTESEAEAESEVDADVDDDNGGNDVGLDVNKKADEFIAKFREQIRLQRIETIRRSTAQRAAGKTCR